MADKPSHPTRHNSGSTIRQLKQSAIEWGMEIERLLTDDYGLYCIRLATSRKSTYCISKSYQYQAVGSFPKRVVLRAADRDTPLTVFFGDEPRIGNAYTFSSKLVEVEGRENMSDQEDGRRELWVDVPLENGVNFGDWITWRSDLPTVSSRYY